MKLPWILLTSAIAVLLWELVWLAFAPYGYEDETGFHAGKELTPEDKKELEHEDY